jgi:predicted Zn finger-like uncharacterized protein
MIIACENCHRKFRLDERLLKPAGSRVRCSKCGALFRARPPEAAPAAPVLEPQPPGQPVSVPITCTELDDAGLPVSFHIGRVSEVSRGRLVIEVFCGSAPERVGLAFISRENQECRIEARVLDAAGGTGGKMRLGLTLLGSNADAADFVKHLAQAHDRRLPNTGPTA